MIRLKKLPVNVQRNMRKTGRCRLTLGAYHFFLEMPIAVIVVQNSHLLPMEADMSIKMVKSQRESEFAMSATIRPGRGAIVTDRPATRCQSLIRRWKMLFISFLTN